MPGKHHLRGFKIAKKIGSPLCGSWTMTMLHIVVGSNPPPLGKKLDPPLEWFLSSPIQVLTSSTYPPLLTTKSISCTMAKDQFPLQVKLKQHSSHNMLPNDACMYLNMLQNTEPVTWQRFRLCKILGMTLVSASHSSIKFGNWMSFQDHFAMTCAKSVYDKWKTDFCVDLFKPKI